MSNYDRNLVHTNFIIHMEQAKVYADVLINDPEFNRDYKRRLKEVRSNIAGLLNFVADVQNFDIKFHEEVSADVGLMVNDIIRKALYGSSDGK